VLQNHSTRERLTVIEVPVLMVFTKLDALETQAFVQLMGQGVDLNLARKETAAMAHKILATHFQEPFETTNGPPTDYVRLDGAQLYGSVSIVIDVYFQICAKTMPTVLSSSRRLLKPSPATPFECCSYPHSSTV
jgi:hypothetical protein